MALSAEQIKSDRDIAISAISAASSLEDLKQLKIDHIGDKSPLSKANQLLGSLDANQRAEFGKLIGAARAVVNQAFAVKNSELEI
jgi:phenylalanyl-tRNA synthetase alpha chain